MKTECSWCLAESRKAPTMGASSGICPRHAREMKNLCRRDSTRFHPLLLILVLLYLGLMFGAGVATLQSLLSP